MPSTNKTSHLFLNKWLGSDKPKKDDFNLDNARIDEACKAMHGRIGSLEGTAQANGAALTEVSATLTGLEQTVSRHTGDGAIHVTAAEKAAWNTPQDTMTIGTYAGNGAATRKITLGFRPKLGFVYAVGQAVVQTEWSGQESKVYAGFFGVSGCSRNIKVDSTGFTVTHTASRPADGGSYKLNETNVTYVYMAWPV